MTYKRYTILLFLLASTAMALSSLTTQPPSWAGVLVLVVLAAVAEWLAFDLPVLGSVSLSFAVINSASLLYGPVAAGIVGAIAGAIPSSGSVKKDSTRIAFNIAQLALSGLVGGWAYSLLGGVNFAGSQVATLHFPTALIPLAASASGQFFCNAMLVAIGVSLAMGIPASEVWRQGMSSFIRSFMILALFGFVMAQLVATAQTIGLLLLLVPFLATRQTFQVYSKLKEAYSDTVRSLVNAVEAKDVYTRGHSERVAVYSRRIAEQMGVTRLSPSQIEIAALLHDIGKLGVPNSVLSKPGSLTPEEFEQVRSHPGTGKELLRDVSFLRDIVPLVYAHHERLDGTGYPQGLKDHEVSVEARVLAVADAYDAMTSERPYRSALEPASAIRELERGAGTQFDSKVVAALVASLEQDSDILSSGL